MRVLHLRQSRKMYGPEKTILGFCRGLAKFGCQSEIGLIYRSFRGDPEHHPMGEMAREQGICYEELDGRLSQFGKLVAGLQKRLQDQAVDVLHTHDYKADLVGILATRSMRRRPALVATPRHSESGWLLEALQWLDRQFLDRFDRITESSEASFTKLSKDARLRGKMRLVLHGNEAGVFGKGEALPLIGEGPVVSMVGRLYEVKGHSYFLRAMAKVSERVPTVQVLIAGEGPLEAELKHLCQELGIATRVQFLGYRRDVDQILGASQVTVVGSQFETSCRTAMEAMHLGCPLVATPVGVIPGMIGDNEAGLLTEYGNVASMAEAILRMLEEPGLAKQLSARGIERSRKFGNHEDAAEVLAGVYAEALSEQQ